MRVAIVTESFLPDVNGVAHSVQRVVEHLTRRGQPPLVIAPEPADDSLPAPADANAVVRVASVPMPGYPSFRIGLPSRKVEAALREYAPDVVHLASPFAFAAYGAFVADRLGIPSVAVYQTDIAGFAAFYKLGLGRAAAWRWLRHVHGVAGRTLAPSTAAAESLTQNGVPRVHLWPRGVDGVRFHPRHRDDALRRRLAPGGEVLVGYLGRLAPEKSVELLEPVTRMPGVRVVVVGDGPARKTVEKALPRATFLGQLTGRDLAAAHASFDVFAHTGAHETFCQSVQEAMASGVPVVAPAAGGPLDLVQPGRTGYLFTPGDADMLRAAVQLLVDDADLRAELGTAGRRAVESRSWAAIGDALLEHYAAVAGVQPARAA
jgi:phosphatidylinositol alpha 1,6-mannosyltransferase